MRYLYFIENASFFDRVKYTNFLQKIEKNPVLKKNEQILVCFKFMNKLGYIDNFLKIEILNLNPEIFFKFSHPDPEDFFVLFEIYFLFYSLNFTSFNDRIVNQCKERGSRYIFNRYFYNFGIFFEYFFYLFGSYYSPNLNLKSMGTDQFKLDFKLEVKNFLKKFKENKDIKVYIEKEIVFRKIHDNIKVDKVGGKTLDLENKIKKDFYNFDNFDMRSSFYYLVILLNIENYKFEINFQDFQIQLENYYRDFIRVFKLKKNNIFFSGDLFHLATLYKLLEKKYKIKNYDLDVVIDNINNFFKNKRNSKDILKEFRKLENKNIFSHILKPNIKINEQDCEINNLPLFDKKGFFNKFGLMNFIKDERIFKIYLIKSELKKQIGNIIKKHDIIYKMNIIDFPFIYDFEIFYNKEKIIINCIDADKVYLNFYKITLKEELTKNKYLELNNRKYINITAGLQNKSSLEIKFFEKLNNLH